MVEGFTEGIWFELVILGALVWLGYMGARVAGRFNLPSVTGFLLVGIVLGPYGLGLLSLELLEKIGFVNTLALGLIVFLIGEELTGKMLVASPLVVLDHRDRQRCASRHPCRVRDGRALPAAGSARLGARRDRDVGCAGHAHERDRRDESQGPLVRHAARQRRLLRHRDGRGLRIGRPAPAAAGRRHRLRRRWPEHRSSASSSGGVALGVAVGLVLAFLLRRTKEQGEILAIGSVHVLLVVAAAHLLGVSTLLAPLAMGVTVAVMEERIGNRHRCFNAMRTVEYPVYIIFFTLAGAELDFKLIFAGGVLALMLAYIVARSAGKFLAGFGGSLLSGITADRRRGSASAPCRRQASPSVSRSARRSTIRRSARR